MTSVIPEASTATPTEDQRPHSATEFTTLDCTNLAQVTAFTDRLAVGLVNSARLAADPRITDPGYRVTPADDHDWFRYAHEAEVMNAAADTDGGVGIPDDTFHQQRLLALVQAYTQVWGSGHGRKLADEYTAQLTDAAAFLTTQAVSVSLNGLQTNPHDVADRLHRTIDNAQGWHLAEVGDHSEAQAYADSRFSSAALAMADAMKASTTPARMALALRTALDMVLAEQAAGVQA